MRRLLPDERVDEVLMAAAAAILDGLAARRGDVHYVGES
jgi:hypothetical protein